LKGLGRTTPSIATSQVRQVFEQIAYGPVMHRKPLETRIKKHRRLKKEGGNLLRGIPPMRQKLCPGFVEDANAIDRRDTQNPGDF
jgi:hypothetical protein